MQMRKLEHLKGDIGGAGTKPMDSGLQFSLGLHGFQCSHGLQGPRYCEDLSIERILSPRDPANVVEFAKKSRPIFVSSITEHKASIERLVSEIDEYYNLPPGWDNESEDVTNPCCLDLAKKFAFLLGPKHKIPDFSAATGEEVALYWQEKKFYFIVHFFQNNSLKFFCKKPGRIISGVIETFPDSIPLEIEIFILKERA